jgi:hypothetical protein
VIRGLFLSAVRSASERVTGMVFCAGCVSPCGNGSIGAEGSAAVLLCAEDAAGSMRRQIIKVRLMPWPPD